MRLSSMESMHDMITYSKMLCLTDIMQFRSSVTSRLSNEAVTQFYSENSSLKNNLDQLNLTLFIIQEG